MERSEKQKNKIWGSCFFWFLLVLGLVFLIIPWIIDIYRKSKKKRLEDELKNLENRKYIIIYFKNDDDKKLTNLEKWYKKLPYAIRTAIVFLVLLIDFGIFKIFINPCVGLTAILKDITAWNATILSVYLSVIFIRQGKIVKLEDIVTSIQRKVEHISFNCYFPEVTQKIESLQSHKKNTTEIDNRITQILGELKNL